MGPGCGHGDCFLSSTTSTTMAPLWTPQCAHCSLVIALIIFIGMLFIGMLPRPGAIEDLRLQAPSKCAQWGNLGSHPELCGAPTQHCSGRLNLQLSNSHTGNAPSVGRGGYKGAARASLLPVQCHCRHCSFIAATAMSLPPLQLHRCHCSSVPNAATTAACPSQSVQPLLLVTVY